MVNSLNYTDIVSYKTAKILNNTLYSDYSDSKYAGEDLECTNDQSLGVRKYKEGQLIEFYEDYVHGKYYFAPLYGDVLDWLFIKFGIIIELSPAYTFSTKDHTAYFYKVWKKNDKDSKFDFLFEDQDWFGSFKFTIDDILEKLVNDKYIEIKYGK